MTPLRRYGALLGVVSAGLGLAVSELLSGLFGQRVSPVIAVAESIIALTPGAVIEFVISLVGTYDKPLLVASTLLGLTAVSAVVGMVATRSLMLAQLVFVAMGVVLVLAVGERLTSSLATYVPAAAGVLVAMATMAVLTPRAVRAASARSAMETALPLAVDIEEPSRRQFLVVTGSVAGVAVATGVFGRVLAQGRAAVDAARRRLNLPVRGRSAPAGAVLGIDGITPWVTSQDTFYRIDTALSIPQVLPDEWELRIHGMVDRELSLTYQDLLDYGLTHTWLTLCCVSNEVGGNLIGNAWWSGVRIADVLADAGVQGGADAVLSTSEDGWTCGTPLEALTDDRHALFAVAMNGEPLTQEHGFPVRMVVPGLYGYVSATKWVVDLEVSRFEDFSAFWTGRGWSEEGPVKTQSRIDVPGDGDQLDSGRVAIGGVAWAQHRGIEAVEIRVDDGEWQRAELGGDVTIDSWRQWSFAWDATSGEHEIAVRATDATGETQTGDVADVVPDGATGWHTIRVGVR